MRTCANLLHRLGDPAEVGAVARSEPSENMRTSGSRRVGAIDVLALVLTPFISAAGVILLWTSPVWNRRDKLIGTLLPPGGYLPLALLPVVMLGDGFTSTCGTSIDSHGSVASSCAGFTTLPAWQQDLVASARSGPGPDDDR